MLEQARKVQSGPVTLAYEADLLGNIQQALAGLQGFGVMALELIQNADDAGADVLAFDVTDSALFVRNDGVFSSCGLLTPRCPWETEGDPGGVHRSCNFHALSRMGSRNKVTVASQIGRFGIGFVSVYQITDSPIVRSAGLEMTLLPLEGAGSTRMTPDVGGSEVELRWAMSPSATRKALNASPTPENVVSLVVEAIDQTLANSLFFLRHLRRVDLRRNGELVRSVAIARDDAVLTLTFGPQARIERWMLLSRDAGDLAAARDIFTDFPTLAGLDRSQTVTVAVPLDGDPVTGLLYAYLPTEQASGLPVHINADFFPHPTRRSITLTGEQHERYWNELLLDTAAQSIAEQFQVLRDLVGAERLWALVGAAFALREKPSFRAFWAALQPVARDTECVMVVDGSWATPPRAFLADLSAEERAALASIGMPILDEALRPHWTVLSSLGTTPLRLGSLVIALEAEFARHPIDAQTAQLRALWSAVDAVIVQSKARPDFGGLAQRLKAVTFLLDVDDAPASASGLWRPVQAPASLIRTYIADCPIAHVDVLALPEIAALVEAYGFGALASDLAAALPDENAAKALIGTEPDRVRAFYGLLTHYDLDPAVAEASTRLAQTPILRTASGFTSPSRGQLPGGFIDPIGYLELVDASLMTERMQRFAREGLEVEILTLQAYVTRYLPDILAAGPVREPYVALLTEILDHRNELEGEGGLAALKSVEFVRTRAGGYATPGDCYYWSSQLEVLLGEDDAHWVDETWTPAPPVSGRFRDLLEARLGMRTTASIGHLVARIETIATTQGIDDIARNTTPIVRHLMERFTRLEPSEKATLERLKTLEWLPGAMRGERVPRTRYPPSMLYRSFRAPAFLSQVHVVDLPILRGAQSGRALAEFLDFLAMPEEPPTEAVVAHLEHCIETGAPASDVTYAMLSERLDRPDGACIDRLSEKAFIYDAQLKRYLTAGEVFWSPPPFPGHWHAASPRMAVREALYRRLGVVGTPSARHYAALARQIAAQIDIDQAGIAVHERCLGWLAEALEGGDLEAQASLTAVRDAPILLNLCGGVVWPDEAAWRDSEILALPFSGGLDDRLVAPPASASRQAAARLFRELDVMRFSQTARLQLAVEPASVVDPDATARLRERADLLLWLAANTRFYGALHDMLYTVEVRSTDTLEVHTELFEYDPPVQSTPMPAAAFYATESRVLYVRRTAQETIDWTAALRALFAPLEDLTHGIDLPPLIMTAAFIASLGSAAEAERALRSADYHPPEIAEIDLSLAGSLSDAPQDGDDVEEADAASEPVPDEDGQVQETLDRDGPSFDGVGSETDEPVASMDGPASRDEGDTPAPSDGPIDSGTPFKSRTVSGAFGEGDGDDRPASTPPAESGADREVSGFGSAAPGPGGFGGAPTRASGPSRAERQERRSRMLAYANAKPRDPGASPTDPSGERLHDLIDVAAVEAVMAHERRSGRLPVEQPHNHPGFDIVSAAADASGRRLIEVKGLEGAWTERGVKLSHVQFAAAQAHPQNYWIYVVEHARDAASRRVTAVFNPFSKVTEYWFDHGWKDVAEERLSPKALAPAIGARLKHSQWGEGVVEQVNQRGMALSLVVAFDDHGSKLIPFSAQLEFLD